LLELDSALSSAAITQSQSSVRSNQASVELATANEKRIRELYAQEFVSKQELDTAVQVLKSAKAQLESARGLLTRDQTNLNFTIIRSPVSGTVVNRVVDVGQTVAASFQTPTLIQIAQDLAKMQIDTSFAEADIGKIKDGQKVKFNVDAFPNRNFEGVVKQVRLNSTNTSNVVTYNVVVSVDNSDLTLLPGMTAYVNIAVANAQQSLMVPNAALRYKPKVNEEAAISDDKGTATGDKSKEMGKGAERKRNGGGRNGKKPEDLTASKIYILKDGKPTMVRIHVGITDGRFTAITGRDLSAGDKVIVSDLQVDGKPQAGGNAPRGPRMF